MLAEAPLEIPVVLAVPVVFEAVPVPVSAAAAVETVTVAVMPIGQ